MSHAATKAAWAANLKPTGLKLTVVALADWCDDNGGRLYPSMSAIAKRVGVTPAQARRHVHALIELGLLSVEANPHGGARSMTPKYRLHIDRLTTNTGDRGNVRATGDVDECDPLHPCAEGLASMHETANADASQPVNSHQKSVQQPSKARVARTDFDPVADLVARGVPEQVACDYNALWNRAPLTATAISALEREAAKAGCSVASAITGCISRGLRKFEAEWVAVDRNQKPGNGRHRERDERTSRLAPGVAEKRPNFQPDYIDVEAKNAPLAMG